MSQERKIADRIGSFLGMMLFCSGFIGVVIIIRYSYSWWGWLGVVGDFMLFPIFLPLVSIMAIFKSGDWIPLGLLTIPYIIQIIFAFILVKMEMKGRF